MKINKFKILANSGEFARTNLYDVRFGNIKMQPLFTTNLARNAQTDQISMMARNAVFPGKQLGSIDAKRFGAIFKVANDVIVDTVSMTFMCSEDMRERLFFEGWINSIYNIDNNTFKHGAKTFGSQYYGKDTMYRMAYYDDYTTSINIINNDRKGKKETYNVELIEAYPASIGPVELAYGDAGEIATFTVSFNCRDWFANSETGMTQEGKDDDQDMEDEWEMRDEMDSDDWIEHWQSEWEFDDIAEQFAMIEVNNYKHDKLEEWELNRDFAEAEDSFKNRDEQIEWEEQQAADFKDINEDDSPNTNKRPMINEGGMTIMVDYNKPAEVTLMEKNGYELDIQHEKAQQARAAAKAENERAAEERAQKLAAIEETLNNAPDIAALIKPEFNDNIKFIRGAPEESDRTMHGENHGQDESDDFGTDGEILGIEGKVGMVPTTVIENGVEITKTGGYTVEVVNDDFGGGVSDTTTTTTESEFVSVDALGKKVTEEDTTTKTNDIEIDAHGARTETDETTIINKGKDAWTVEDSNKTSLVPKLVVKEVPPAYDTTLNNPAQEISKIEAEFDMMHAESDQDSMEKEWAIEQERQADANQTILFENLPDKPDDYAYGGESYIEYHKNLDRARDLGALQTTQATKSSIQLMENNGWTIAQQESELISTDTNVTTKSNGTEVEETESTVIQNKTEGTALVKQSQTERNMESGEVTNLNTTTRLNGVDYDESIRLQEALDSGDNDKISSVTRDIYNDYEGTNTNDAGQSRYSSINEDDGQGTVTHTILDEDINIDAVASMDDIDMFEDDFSTSGHDNKNFRLAGNELDRSVKSLNWELDSAVDRHTNFLTKGMVQRGVDKEMSQFRNVDGITQEMVEGAKNRMQPQMKGRISQEEETYLVSHIDNLGVAAENYQDAKWTARAGGDELDAASHTQSMMSQDYELNKPTKVTKSVDEVANTKPHTKPAPNE